MAENAEGLPAPRKALEPGRVLNNNYRILERIGEGGMGAVWRAANIFMEEDHVAIKVIRTEQADDDLFRQMFGKEVKAMLRLNNPRLVAYRTFAHDPELDISFIVTEFIDGPSLKSLIGRRNFAPAELLSLLTELAIGLRAAHKAGIIHRDLAPDNVLLEDGDICRPKIIDFGIVKDTAGDGTTIIGSGFAGKYGFVAPEQLGEPDYAIGPWTDIYSLGLVILGLARGKAIDMGNTPGAAIRRRRDAPDLSPIAAPMQPLLAAMLATHPDDRIRSADELLDRAQPLFAQLEDWAAPDDEDILPTVVTPTPAAPIGPMGSAITEEEEPEEDEVTQIVAEVSAVKAEPDAEAGDYDDDYDDDNDDDAFAGEEERGKGKAARIGLGVIAAIALAIVGGMALGEFASPFEEGNAQDPALAAVSASTDADGEIAPPPEATAPPPEVPAMLPEIAIVTSVPPDAGVRPVDPAGWVRQDDLPRQLFGEQFVRGIVAAYLDVAPDGSVTRCTIGASSEAEPAEMLRPSAVNVCRALRSRARFEPFVIRQRVISRSATIQARPPVQAPVRVPAQVPVLSPVPAPTALPGPPQGGPTELAPPPEPETREVFVRVAFRTAGPRQVSPPGP